MANCKKCGAACEANVNVCPICGEPVVAETANVVYDAEDVKNNKFLAALAYLGWFWVIAWLDGQGKASKFVRFHVNQGLAIIVLAFLGALVNIVPFLGQLACIVIEIACVVFMVMGVINALGGKFKEVPLVGKFKILK